MVWCLGLFRVSVFFSYRSWRTLLLTASPLSTVSRPSRAFSSFSVARVRPGVPSGLGGVIRGGPTLCPRSKCKVWASPRPRRLRARRGRVAVLHDTHGKGCISFFVYAGAGRGWGGFSPICFHSRGHPHSAVFGESHVEFGWSSGRASSPSAHWYGMWSLPVLCGPSCFLDAWSCSPLSRACLSRSRYHTNSCALGHCLGVCLSTPKTRCH